jgi:hypothetical protein
MKQEASYSAAAADEGTAKATLLSQNGCLILLQSSPIKNT